ncbi:MAG: hypothetical protein MJ157_03315, partial [Clostridia bacterium]|nr:hypothetical protein [Clostridia bacterium]
MAFKVDWKKYALTGADQRQKAARHLDFGGILMLVWILTWLWLYPVHWLWLLTISGLEALLLGYLRRHWGHWQGRQSRQRQLIKLAKEQIQALNSEAEWADFWENLWTKLGCQALRSSPEQEGNSDLKLWQGAI